MRNPLNDKDLADLSKAVFWSRRRLERFQENRKRMVDQYVGAHYSESGPAQKVPVNFIEQALNIYSRQLTAKAPQALVLTHRQQLKPAAHSLELAVNRLIGDLQLGNTFRLVALDGLFSVGLCKIGQALGGQVEIDGFMHDVGQTYADPVSLDDWVHDMNATRWDQIQFCGHMFVQPLHLAREFEAYNKSVRHELTATELSPYNEFGGEKVSNLGSDEQFSREMFRPVVRLMELWLPIENLILTLRVDDTGPSFLGKPLRVEEWTGPEEGPYRRLAFNDVPDNTMPLPPVALMEDLHELGNKVFRKLMKQVERQKTIGVFGPGDAEQAERVTNASDGEVTYVDNADGVKEIRFGGPDQTAAAMFIQIKQLFSWHAGNLEALGGLGPQSSTVGQDKMLSQSASQRVSGMQEKVQEFSKDVLKDLMFYLWNDPLARVPIVKKGPGGAEISAEWNSAAREGGFPDYELQVQPYSMQDRSPAERLQGLMQVFQTFIPLAPQLAEQGLTFDFTALVKLFGKYMNMPEVAEILRQGAELPEEEKERPQKDTTQTARPPNTTRTYERVNRPGGTQQGQEQAMMSFMMGKNQQPAEAAAMDRQVA